MISLIDCYIMTLLNKILKYLDLRVQKFGAQYSTFAIFGLINYPFAIIFEYFIIDDRSGICVRTIATILCLILLLKNYWPHKLKKYLPLYWYSSITFCLPILTTYLLFRHNMSLEWSMNYTVGVLIEVLILDAVAFIIVQLIGITIGVSVFYVFGNTIQQIPSSENFTLFLYILFCNITFGFIFSRSKEIYNHLVQSSLKRAVRLRTQELEEALAFKTLYLTNMSHEIRTPVHGFTALSNLLSENWDLFTDEKRLQISKEIYNNSERLKNLVSNLLDLSKHSSGKWKLNLTKFNFNQLVIDVIDEAQNLYMFKKRVDINLDDKEEFAITADYHLIGQVLRNLFANAIKFSSDEMGILKVKIRKVKNEILEFSLKDNGVVIPSNELESIFEEFVQSSKTITKAGGTGLGLAICKKIITLHHGVIWAKNNKGQSGACIIFRLYINYEKKQKNLIVPIITTK